MSRHGFLDGLILVLAVLLVGCTLHIAHGAQQGSNTIQMQEDITNSALYRPVQVSLPQDVALLCPTLLAALLGMLLGYCVKEGR